MIKTSKDVNQLPCTLEEFLIWEPIDGFKYEWSNEKLIQFAGMKQKEFYIYDKLNLLFFEKDYYRNGVLMAEPDVMLTNIQMRRPDIAFFTREQVYQGHEGVDVIPEFVIEIISETDQLYKIEDKLTEYFKAGVKVVWNIVPNHEIVYVYTSRKNVKICTDNDVCSAASVLPEFEIKVSDMFVVPTTV